MRLRYYYTTFPRKSQAFVFVVFIGECSIKENASWDAYRSADLRLWGVMCILIEVCIQTALKYCFYFKSTRFLVPPPRNDFIFSVISFKQRTLASYAPHAICGVRQTLSKSFISYSGFVSLRGSPS